MGKKEKKQPQKQTEEQSQSPLSLPADSAEIVDQETIAQPASSTCADSISVTSEGDSVLSCATSDSAPAAAIDSDSAPAPMSGPESDADLASTSTDASPTDSAAPQAPSSVSTSLHSGTAPPDFQAKTTLRQDAISKIIFWIKDQKTLSDAFLVALSFHVIMFPVLWVVGWALPWPKPPVVTTIIEFDLQDWMKSGKPKKVIEFRDPELNE